MLDWLLNTLKDNVEIPLFMSLLIGYSLGKVQIKGISLGDVTATLLAALVIGQIGITVSSDIKTIFFVMYLFAVGYSAGPQFVRGIFSGGLQQAAFAALVCALSLGAVYLAVKIAGYDVGIAAGLYAGSTTTSSAIGLSQSAIAQSALSVADKARANQILPAAFSISYVIGTFGAVIVLGILGPKLLKIDLASACREYIRRVGGEADKSGRGTAWHQYVARAYRIDEESSLSGLTVVQAEHFFDHHRLFLARIRRNGAIIEATTSTVLEPGDVIALSGSRSILLEVVGKSLTEVDDAELLGVQVEGSDILITAKNVHMKTLAEIAELPETRGLFLTAIRRGAMSVSIPILPDTKLYRGDVVTVVGRSADVAAVANRFGYLDRETDRADIAFIGAAIAIGALIGAFSFKVGSVPLTLSTAGGVLLVGLLFGWLRSVRPAFGRVPRATTWFMNSIGLNMFIAVVGLSAGPSVLAGLKELGVVFVLWSILAAALPMLLSIYIGKYLFRFDDAILFGCCAGSRTAAAALNMITDKAESQVPAIGYSVAYATSSTILTLLGIVIVVMT
ncbi:aspartate-alanine antiporter [Martelella mediterranea]|uniref:Putative transport protein n=1 Tax=Martelella mediterranea TaxID=293089 RepID=A0A4V2V3I9_9HYPH|nr:aspartate-alanine antiporter [Martelella mediterranea]TCT33024.1 putative transport protein [Martelella mediterranea]